MWLGVVVNDVPVIEVFLLYLLLFPYNSSLWYFGAWIFHYFSFSYSLLNRPRYEKEPLLASETKTSLMVTKPFYASTKGGDRSRLGQKFFRICKCTL